MTFLCLRRAKLVWERELKDMSVVLMTAERSNASAVALNEPLVDMTGWGMNWIRSKGPDTYTSSKDMSACSLLKALKKVKPDLQETSCSRGSTSNKIRFEIFFIYV